MRDARLPLGARIGVVVVCLLLVIAVLLGAVAIGYGSTALQATSGGITMSARSTPSAWFGLELENPSAVPATLRFVRTQSVTDARVVEARVLDHEDAAGSGVGVVSPPVGGPEGAAIARSRPVRGFVLPPHSRNRYQLILLVERVRPGNSAVIRRTDIGYTAIGLDHGLRSGAVLCIPASGARTCH